MKRYLLRTLEKGIKDTLQGNRLAKCLYTLCRHENISFNQRERLLNLLMANWTKKEEVSVPPHVSTDSYRDLSFTFLTFENVKKYPKGLFGIPFGISFSKNSTPVHSVFIGSNGVGKTSVYALLEFICMGKMNTAELRGFAPSAPLSAADAGHRLPQSLFILHKGASPQDLQGHLSCRGNSVFQHGMDGRSPLVPDSFFCSEFDIYELEKTMDLSGYFLTQIGLGPYNQALQLVYALKSYCEEHSFSDSVSEKPTGNHGPDSSKETFLAEWHALTLYLEHGIQSILKEWEDGIKSNITELLEGYFLADNDYVKVELNVHSYHDKVHLPQASSGAAEWKKSNVWEFVEFDIKILSCLGNLDLPPEGLREETDPKSYLNTFKYKLFCVALKVALGTVAKQYHNLNHPFVIDDVFDSSDFNNRLHLKDFAKALVEAHNKLLPDAAFSPQFIFFTQDDLIAQQFKKGLESASGHGKVKFSRIFDYRECTEADIVNNPDGENAASSGYVSVEDPIS